MPRKCVKGNGPMADVLFAFSACRVWSWWRMSWNTWGVVRGYTWAVVKDEGCRIGLRFLAEFRRVYTSKAARWRWFWEGVACPKQHNLGAGCNQTHQALEDKYSFPHSAGARDIDMVFREVENLKALTHPNIVKILNCYTLSNMQLVVVM